MNSYRTSTSFYSITPGLLAMRVFVLDDTPCGHRCIHVPTLLALLWSRRRTVRVVYAASNFFLLAVVLCPLLRHHAIDLADLR